MESVSVNQTEKSVKEQSNEQLLDLFIAARALEKLHSQKGGLEQSRLHSEAKLKEYRDEILRRMGQANNQQGGMRRP